MRSDILLRETLEYFERGEFDSVEIKIKSLIKIGLKKEANVLKNLVFIKKGEFEKIDFGIEEIPDYIRGYYYFKKFNIIDKNLFAGLHDTLRFFIIFYFYDTDEIKRYIDSLNLPEIYRELGKGYILFKEKRYKEALTSLKEVYERWQELFIAELIVLSYTYTKSWDSLILFTKDLYKNSTINYCLGTALYNKGYFKEAQEIFKVETIGIYRRNALYALGWCNFYLERYKESIFCFNRFLEENKNGLKIPALYRIGRSYLKLGDIKALHYFKEIMREFPESDFADDAVYLIGKTYFNISNKTDSAKKYLLKLIVDYPESRWVPFCTQYLGDIYFNEGNYEKSRMYYDISLKYKLSKNYSDEVQFKMAYSEYMLGKYRSELEFYKTFIAKFPTNSKVPELYEKIGDIYSVTRRFEDAIKNWLIIINKYREYQNFQEVLLKIFKGYARIMEVDKGIQIIEDEIKKGLKGKDNILKEVGDFFFESGEYPTAISYYGRIEDEKLKSIIYYKLGYSYYKLELIDETKAIIKSLLDEYPDSPFYDKGFLLFLQCLMKEGNEEEINDLLNFRNYKISGDTKIEANLLVAEYYCSKSDPRALDFYTKAITLCENDFQRASNIFFLAAECAEKIGFKEKAEDFRMKGKILKK